MSSIKFPNVKVWNREMFKYFDKYVVMYKMNGLRTEIETKTAILDCEEINGKLIILDAYRVFDTVINEKPFLERLKYAEYYIKRNKLENVYEVIKPLEITGLKQLFEILYETDKNDEIDGLVLRNKQDSFLKSRVYKLKTPKMSTIDFLLKDNKLYSWHNKKIIPFEFPLLKGSSEYLNKELNKEIYTEKEIKLIEELKKQDLNNKIIEMSWDGFNWQPLKIRDDKTRPNKIEFAISNAENIFYPMSFENAYKEFENCISSNEKK